MNQLLFAIGLTVVFLGLFLLTLGLLLEMRKKKRGEEKEEEGKEQKTEYGGVIFIGPIPIVFGSNKKIAKTMLIIGIVIFAILMVLTLITYL